jgi:hypothetical protein
MKPKMFLAGPSTELFATTLTSDDVHRWGSVQAIDSPTSNEPRTCCIQETRHAWFPPRIWMPEWREELQLKKFVA